jgi:hypothetical protein
MGRAAYTCEDLVYRVRDHIPGGSSAHPYSNIVRSFPEIALDVAIKATTNPEDRLSLVQRYKQLEIMSEFLDSCRRTSHEVLAQAGGAEDPVLHLMGIIAMEAYLQNPALRQCGEEVGETMVKVLKPEHLR